MDTFLEMFECQSSQNPFEAISSRTGALCGFISRPATALWYQLLSDLCRMINYNSCLYFIALSSCFAE